MSAFRSPGNGWCPFAPNPRDLKLMAGLGADGSVSRGCALRSGPCGPGCVLPKPSLRQCHLFAGFAGPLRFLRLATISATMLFGNALGWLLGADRRVAIGRIPSYASRWHHLTMVLWVKPVYRAACRVDQPRHFTKRTASILTLAKCGFFEYAICLDSAKG